jgi:hypothetical protein
VWRNEKDLNNRLWGRYEVSTTSRERRRGGWRNCTRVTENGAEVGVWGGRGGREAVPGVVKVTSIGVGQVKAIKLDSPLAWGAGVIGGAVRRGQLRQKAEMEAGRSPRRAEGQWRRKQLSEYW